MLTTMVFSTLLLALSFLLMPAPEVLLTVQVVGAGDLPASGVALTLTQQPSGTVYEPCTTDSAGRCSWSVPGLRLYEIGVAGQGVSAETALALGDAGLRGLGVMLGIDDHVQTLFLLDGTVYIADPADPAQPYIPAAGESSRYLETTPTVVVPPAVTATPAPPAIVTANAQSSGNFWAGLFLITLLAALLCGAAVVMFVRRREESKP